MPVGDTSSSVADAKQVTEAPGDEGVCDRGVRGATPQQNREIQYPFAAGGGRPCEQRHAS